MIQTQSQAFDHIIARTELIKLTTHKCLFKIAPETAEYAIPLIDRAFDLEAFRSLSFYARRGDRLAFASLRIEFDRDEHEQQLLVCPEVGLDSSWVGGLAPDLRAASDYFRGLSMRLGKSVAVRMVVRRTAWPEPIEKAPPVLWVPGPQRAQTEKVTALPELSCTVRLIDTAPV